VIFTTGRRRIGEDRSSASGDATVVSAAKRLIGREFSESTDYEAMLGYRVTQGPKNLPVIPFGRERFSPEQITAMILGHARAALSEQLQEDVVDAVVTVPAFFSNSQRQATIDAASIAGFNVLRLQSESVATLLAKPYDSKDRYLVVVDFGAGKLDLSLVQQAGADLTILRTAGDTQFGGIDLDRAVAGAVSRDIPKEASVSRTQLLAECQKAREALSRADETTISLGEFTKGLTRQELNDILSPLYRKVTDCLNDLFEANKITADKVKEVHVGGGLANVPEVVSLIKEFFSGSVVITTANSTAVVIGAAMEGARLKDIAKNRLPKVNIRQTTSLSIGFSVADGTGVVLIPRGSILPAKKCTLTTTSRDNQRNVGFEVLEGERKMAKDNVKLGTLIVDGIQQAPRGVPKIEITMEINEDGILVVTALDTKTGAVITTTIESASNLSRSDIHKMIADAEAHKADDNRILKRTQWRTRLGSYVDGLLQKEINDEEQRALLAKNVAVWKKWNADHQNELVADAYIRQYFEIRKVIKQILA
jgi:molecular chaperone DnaK